MEAHSIVDYLARHARETPGKAAYIILEDGEERERQVSFSALEDRVRALSFRFSLKGWKGRKAILLYDDVIDFTLSFLACQHAGIVAIPVFFSKGARQMARLDGIINDSGARLVLSASSLGVGKHFPAGYFDNDQRTLFFSDTDDPSGAGIADGGTGKAEISFIQYTSGSTGNPKGIVISTANLLANQRSIGKTFGCDRDSVILSWLPFYHDMGLIGNILHALYVGCTCVLMTPFQFMQEPKRWLKAISRHRVTHSGGPNFAYDLCVNKIPLNEVSHLDLSCWKVAYNGSEPVSADTLQRFAERFGPIGFRKSVFFPCYGLAEATLLVSGAKDENMLPHVISIDKDPIPTGRIHLAGLVTGRSKRIVSSGKVAAGVNVKILSATGAVEAGELAEGEICIAGAGVTTGYWNKGNMDPFLNIDNQMFLRTGDIGFLYNGELFIHGRLKEMLVVRGKNIYPYDIEQAVSTAVPAIHTNGVAAFGLKGQEDELVVVAEYKIPGAGDRDYGHIIDLIEKEVIASAGISPYDIVLTGRAGIPRTTSGKLQRIKCREYYERDGFRAIASKRRAPKDAVYQRDPFLKEAVLADKDTEAIRKYLTDLIRSKAGSFGQSGISDAMELTAIGLDSIKAMEMINAVSRELDIHISISMLFRGNTFGNLVNIIESMLWVKHNRLSGKDIII